MHHPITPTVDELMDIVEKLPIEQQVQLIAFITSKYPKFIREPRVETWCMREGALVLASIYEPSNQS